MEPEVGRDMHKDAESVWEVLADGWFYPLWVVGATHMRDVDADWPAVGSRLHHSVGVWPFQLRDHTEVLDVDPGRRLELLARAWPAGTAHVRLTLQARGPDSCHVRMWEAAADRPWRWIPDWAQAPAVRPRNAECLSRLADIAEHRRHV
ncbi:MAG TPA: SRPBCC family protein [Actinomycetospora sp.]|uniref:SRPBCC family protein n=1 Tax=Actinomycetospora sp. TaxID=1872135 RepID=UPI002F410618